MRARPTARHIRALRYLRRNLVGIKLTTKHLHPVDFPRSLSDSYLQTFLESLLRLQDTRTIAAICY